MKKLLLISILFITLASCTKSSMAKQYGGTTKIVLPCGMKLFDVTWKDNNLWYDMIPMEDGYKPVTHLFKEQSSYGVLEGTVYIYESKCD